MAYLYSRTTLLYFSIGFSVGFLLGIIRVFWGVPLFGAIENQRISI
jgi:hypothetical protein